MQRFSRKRQSILNCLASTKEHPTAEWIYSEIKKEYPDLSLATVYRNLSQLKEEGIVRSVGTVDGKERYDACLAPHAHAVCVKCGRVLDLPSVKVPDTVSDDFAGFKVITAELTFSGICGKCSEKTASEDAVRQGE